MLDVALLCFKAMIIGMQSVGVMGGYEGVERMLYDGSAYGGRDGESVVWIYWDDCAN